MSVNTQDIKNRFYQFINSDIGGNDIAGFGTDIKGCYESCRDNRFGDCYAFSVDSNSDEPSTAVRCQLKKKGEYWDTKDPSFTSGWTTWVKKPTDVNGNILNDWIYPNFNIFYPEIIIQRRIIDFVFDKKSDGETVVIRQNSKCENTGEVFDDKNCELGLQKIFLTKSDSIRINDNNRGYCLKDFNKYCVKLNPKDTCSIEGFPGKCASESCGYGGDWGNIIGNNKFNQGFINCKYSFDYTNFTFNSLTNFKNYIETLYSDKVGMDINLKNRFRDSNYIYACMLDFYSSIYSQFYYSGDNVVNNFKNFDYLRNGLHIYKSGQFFPKINTQIQSYFTSSIVPTGLQHIVEDKLQLPTPVIVSGNPGTYTISLNIPYDMYKKYIEKDQQSRDTYISNLLEGLLRDKEGKIRDVSTGNSWYSNRCNITDTYINTIYAVNVSNTNYDDVREINQSDYGNGSYKDYLFLCCKITGTVNVWSPMLTIYFQILNRNSSLDTITCSTIAQSAGYNSENTSLYPYSCFQRLCAQSAKDDCINRMITACNLSYTPPNPFTSSLVNRYLTTMNSQECACYTSTISPVSESQVGNIAAMCFDKKCDDPDLRQSFNLSDGNCKQYLDKVWKWIYDNNNTVEKARNSQTFDTERFNRLAGKDYQPYQPSSYNWQILVIGIFTVILLSLITFILCRKYDISTTFTVINLVLIITIFGSLTAFFCKDMAGLSSCDRKKFKCTSRYTNIDLPNEFCNYTLNCECQFDGDCSPCSYCFSGTCTPANGTRKTIIVSERKPNIVILILSIILLVLLPTALMFLHDKKFLNIPTWLFNIIIFISCLIPLIIIIYNSLKKVDTVKFDGACSQECNDSCEGKSCGYNDCGRTCGTCNPGTICNENNICEIV